jgi:hypothetical protein
MRGKKREKFKKWKKGGKQGRKTEEEIGKKKAV